MRRLRIFDWNTPWFWLTFFYKPRASGDPILQLALWRPYSWQRWWSHCWKWETPIEEQGGYANFTPDEVEKMAHEADT